MGFRFFNSTFSSCSQKPVMFYSACITRLRLLYLLNKKVNRDSLLISVVLWLLVVVFWFSWLSGSCASLVPKQLIQLWTQNETESKICFHVLGRSMVYKGCFRVVVSVALKWQLIVELPGERWRCLEVIRRWSYGSRLILCWKPAREP